MFSTSDFEITIVGEEFLVMDKAVALPANFSNSLLLKTYDEVLVALEDSGIHERLEKEFVTPLASQCSELTANAFCFQ
eukprot:gene10658-10817_t